MREKSGVVTYCFDEKGNLYLFIVSGRKYEESWVFPVGTVKQGETLAEAARRECREESGYKVKLGEQLTPFEVSYGDSPVRFTYFLATFIGNATDQKEDRERKWLLDSEAVNAVPTVFQPVAMEAVSRIKAMNSNDHSQCQEHFNLHRELSSVS